MARAIKLSKGEILINEGDSSNSLYFVQSGSLRVFKKRGIGFIEFGVINQGSIVGELSFFDNQRRSASVEALRDCEVVEVPRFNFDEYISKQPAWASALLKTMCFKVRDLTDQVKQLESNSTVTKVGEGNRTYREHEFLLPRDVMKLCSSLLLCASLRGSKNESGLYYFPATVFHVLATNVNSIPLAKISIFIDIFKELKLLEVEKAPQMVSLVLRDFATLDRFLFWYSEENAKSAEFRRSVSKLGIALCEAICVWALATLQRCPEHQEYQVIDLSSIVERIAARDSLSPRLYFDTFAELVNLGLGRESENHGKREFEINVRKFLADYPMLRIRSRIEALNAERRGEGKD